MFGVPRDDPVVSSMFHSSSSGFQSAGRANNMRMANHNLMADAALQPDDTCTVDHLQHSHSGDINGMPMKRTGGARIFDRQSGMMGGMCGMTTNPACMQSSGFCMLQHGMSGTQPIAQTPQQLQPNRMIGLLPSMCAQDGLPNGATMSQAHQQPMMPNTAGPMRGFGALPRGAACGGCGGAMAACGGLAMGNGMGGRPMGGMGGGCDMGGVGVGMAAGGGMGGAGGSMAAGGSMGAGARMGGAGSMGGGGSMCAGGSMDGGGMCGGGMGCRMIGGGGVGSMSHNGMMLGAGGGGMGGAMGGMNCCGAMLSASGAAGAMMGPGGTPMFMPGTGMMGCAGAGGPGGPPMRMPNGGGMGCCPRGSMMMRASSMAGGCGGGMMCCDAMGNAPMANGAMGGLSCAGMMSGPPSCGGMVGAHMETWGGDSRRPPRPSRRRISRSARTLPSSAPSAIDQALSATTDSGVVAGDPVAAAAAAMETAKEALAAVATTCELELDSKRVSLTEELLSTEQKDEVSAAASVALRRAVNVLIDHGREPRTAAPTNLDGARTQHRALPDSRLPLARAKPPTLSPCLLPLFAFVPPVGLACSLDLA